MSINRITWSRTIVFSVQLLSLFVFGCTGKTLPTEAPRDEAIANGLPEVESTAGLSIPRLDPKPVVWLDDAKDVDETPQTRREAEDLMSLADRFKAMEKFEQAEKYYQRAMDADPTWAYPVYQSACNYELWDHPNRALSQFMKAVELGFDDFPTALADGELGRIRKHPDFHTAILTIRERYIVSSKTRVGQPIAIRPHGAKPADGWPVMLLLHGYGDTNLSYLDSARQWAERGFVTVAVPGSVPSQSGYYQWAMESIEPTHQDLQAIVMSKLFDGLIDREKVFLLGFSQGALHAMLLTAENPQLYAGVVALSPGGSMANRLANPPLNRSQRPASCVFIHGTEEPHAPLVRIWSAACKTAGWKFDAKTHPGGHQFPENWDKIQPEIAAFLIN